MWLLQTDLPGPHQPATVRAGELAWNSVRGPAKRGGDERANFVVPIVQARPIKGEPPGATTIA